MEKTIDLVFVKGDHPEDIKKKLEEAEIPFEEKGTLLQTLLLVPKSHRSGVSEFKLSYSAVYKIPSGISPAELSRLGTLRI